MLLFAAVCAAKQPHIWTLLFDDYGWADAGWHRNYTAPGGEFVPATAEVQTPFLNSLVREGIELDRAYVFKYCSPSRSALQSGRNPVHVNVLNAAPFVSNANDSVAGFAAIPRNMTGIATKLAAAGYRTHMFGKSKLSDTHRPPHERAPVSAGKWDAGMATPDHTPHGRGYQTAMNYFNHANQYWSMTVASCPHNTTPAHGGVPIVDLWRTTDGDGAAEGPAWGYNNTCIGDQPRGGVDPSVCQPGPHGDTWWGGYEDSLFEQHVLATVHS